MTDASDPPADRRKRGRVIIKPDGSTAPVVTPKTLEPTRLVPEDLRSSEFHGLQLSNTLAERYRQLRQIAGIEAAIEFAIRETMTLLHRGMQREAISQQFNVTLRTVESWIAKGREKLGVAVEKFDATTLVGDYLADAEFARQLLYANATGQKSTPAIRQRAAEGLMRLGAERMNFLDKLGLVRSIAIGNSRDEDPRILEARESFRRMKSLDTDFFGDPNAQPEADKPDEDEGQGDE